MTEALLRALHEPKRNRYFYGKLLDVSHFQMEQAYGMDKRWLLNRLALGSGVLCGLGVTLGADGTLCVDPGVAIDALGREIIVAAGRAGIPADQPTDDNGLPAGDRLAAGQSTVYLCYTECDAEPTPVRVSECDGVATSALSTTVERYRILVRAGLPGTHPLALTAEQRDAIFPTSPPGGFDRRVAAEQTLAITCAEPPAMACVVLATVTLPADGAPAVIDPHAYRAEVFSNTVLFELIAALAERVDACCAGVQPVVTQSIAITGGDDQSAGVGQQLPAPVALLVTDSNGHKVSGADVALATADADAGLSLDGAAFTPTLDASADANGEVAVLWRLGSGAGIQRFTATLASGASVTAHASAADAPPPPATPPVVLRFSPQNGSTVGHSFAEEPRLVIRFDQAMEPNGFANPDGWLRSWFFPTNADGRIDDGRRLKLAPGVPEQGKESTFRGESIDFDRVTVIVMMRGSDPEIVATGSGLALDAEFPGTRLDQDQLDRLWDSDSFVPDDDFRARVQGGGGVLPSGDGTPGGKYFHAFFTIAPAQ